MSAIVQRIAAISVPAPAAQHDGFFAHHGLWAPGVRMFRNLRFAAKAAIISMVFVLPIVVLLGWQLKSQFDQSMQARMDATRQHVEIAHGLIAWAHAQETGGRMTREQAQQIARQAVATLRYDGNEYFWINDMQPRMVMHPIRPELDGKDLSGMRDPNGLALFDAFVATVRKGGEGFVAYQWPKPGSEAPVDRISYVKGYAPWGWIVGSGIYTGDLREVALRLLAWYGTIVCIGLLIAGYLFRSFYLVMDGGLKETRRHLRAMTAGDLTTSPSPWGNDEPAQLMHELRRMQDSLRSIVANVRGTSDTVVRSSGEIAGDAADLSARTEQAAASLERSAASMEQIAAMVKTTSEHTEEASRVARRNADAAIEGGRVMRDVVATMEGIHASSAKIGEIIGTIDGIAFQTNILALNAAVEAARAGDQGRGFAVVAGEVRMLAQRCTEAAKEIKTLIGSGVARIDAGTGIVRRAGSKIEDIVASSQRVSDLLGEIATGAREQSLGIGRIGQAIQDLDRMTQQNAARVEQTAAAAAQMNDQANTLAAEVARFRLPQGA
jgi:methyl-accepting chemotaxis protein